MSMIYKFKPNVVCTIPAQIVGEALDQIRVAHNDRLTQEDVVTAAQPEDSPLHPAFEWDDAKAARLHRLEKAGYLIRSVVVTSETTPEAVPVRAFVNVERDNDRSYTTTAHALSDAELRSQVLSKALKELASWKDRYEDLVELARVFAEADKAIRKLAPKQ